VEVYEFGARGKERNRWRARERIAVAELVWVVVTRWRIHEWSRGGLNQVFLVLFVRVYIGAEIINFICIFIGSRGVLETPI
jgi:hypothetical protein